MKPRLDAVAAEHMSKRASAHLLCVSQKVGRTADWGCSRYTIPRVSMTQYSVEVTKGGERESFFENLKVKDTLLHVLSWWEHKLCHTVSHTYTNTLKEEQPFSYSSENQRHTKWLGNRLHVRINSFQFLQRLQNVRKGPLKIVKGQFLLAHTFQIHTRDTNNQPEIH